MSSLTFHTAQSVITSAALYPILGEHVIPFGVATVLIDLDHVVEYVRDTKCFDIRGLFTYSKLTELNLERNFLVLSAFHTVECFALIAVLAFVYPVLWYLLAGMLYHLAADIVNMIWLGKPFGRAYSLIEYLLRSKKRIYITSMHELLRRQDIITDGVQNFDFWKRRWQGTTPSSEQEKQSRCMHKSSEIISEGP